MCWEPWSCGVTQRETFNYIEASQGLLRSGIAGLLVVSMLAILVPWALYVLLASVHRSLVLLTIWPQVAVAAVGRIRIDSLTDKRSTCHSVCH